MRRAATVRDLTDQLTQAHRNEGLSLLETSQSLQLLGPRNQLLLYFRLDQMAAIIRGADFYEYAFRTIREIAEEQPKQGELL